MSATQRIALAFFDPKAAFERLKNDPRYLFALALVVVATCATWIWYYAVVDIDWLQDKLIEQKGYTAPAEIDMARQVMTRGSLGVFAIAGGVVGIPLLLLAWAGWFRQAANFASVDLPLRKWYAFATWTALPGALLLPIVAVQLALGHGRQTAPDELNPVSLNQLVLGLPPGSAAAAIFNSFSLLSVWTIVLITVGLVQWGVRSVPRALAIALAPYVVFYGGWALVSFLRSGA
ncbi:YIP1 family protein [Tahibacter soli]|uniref:YIP1 family protein n=1 Tax=Tahibacter soli TaxID=2983605 RepID=A0A9X3YMI6_9GAMM|nr:YIP1 family protein [Tahibacter soli]MDC8015037.1 YIP1 family protein [Tahibacter soli]